MPGSPKSTIQYLLGSRDWNLARCCFSASPLAELAFKAVPSLARSTSSSQMMWVSFPYPWLLSAETSIEWTAVRCLEVSWASVMPERIVMSSGR